MNVIIVPGYGDRTDYIEAATKHWSEKYDLTPHIQVFGWNGEANSYDTKWQAMVETVKQVGETAVLGLSAGVGVALRAIQDYPELVKKVVCVSGPHCLADLRPEVVTAKYPLMAASLPPVQVERLSAERIITFAPLLDGVVPPKAVAINGADNRRMPIIGHSISLVWALRFEAPKIANFIHEGCG